MTRRFLAVPRSLLLAALGMLAAPCARAGDAPLGRALLESRARIAGARAAFAAGGPRSAPAAAAARPRTAVVPLPSLEGWAGNGILVSTGTASQNNPQICADGTGGAFFAWWDMRDGFGDVFMNRLDLDGEFPPGWSGAGVNLDPIDKFELFVEVASDGAGGAFSAFTHYHDLSSTFQDITIQRLAGDGGRVAGYPVQGRSLGLGEINGLIARADLAGGLFVVWADAFADVWLLHLDGGGSVVPGWPPKGLALGPAGSFAADLAPDGTGGLWLVQAIADTVRCQRLAADGTTAAGWPEGGVRLTSGGAAVSAVAAAALATGGVMAAWEDARSGDPDLYALRVADDGAIPAPWAIDGVVVNAATGATPLQGVLADGGSGALVTWLDQTGAGGAVAPAAVRIDADGAVAADWPAGGLRLCTPDAQNVAARMIGDGAGGVIGVWIREAPAPQPGVYLQHVEGDGTRPPAFPAEGLFVCPAAVEPLAPVAALDGAGGVILAWEDLRETTPRIVAARVLLGGTVPARLALVAAFATPDLVRIHWANPAGPFTALLARERAGEPPATAREVHSDGGGDLWIADRDVVAGAEYRYRLMLGPSGAAVSEVTLRVPLAPGLAIDAVRPNPSGPRVTLAFTLGSAAPARLDLVDVTGRRVWSRSVGGFGAGAHVLALDTALPPGVYTALLAQDGARARARVVVSESP